MGGSAHEGNAIMALLIKLVLAATSDKTLRQFQRDCRNPRETQEQLLMHYMRRNAASAFF